MRAVDIYDEHEPTPEQKLNIDIHLNANCAKTGGCVREMWSFEFGVHIQAPIIRQVAKIKNCKKISTKPQSVGMGVR